MRQPTDPTIGHGAFIRNYPRLVREPPAAQAELPAAVADKFRKPPMPASAAQASAFDGAVADQPWLCIGSGIRGSKLFVPAATLLGLPGAERVDGLARAIPHEAV